MTQLILNNSIYLPETSGDKYKCWPELLSTQVDMISGRRVLEVRGTVQKISYSYDYMGNELCRQVLSVLRSGAPFPVAYLPDDGDGLVSSSFLCEALTPPTFAFSDDGKPYWHGLSFTLREVTPHD